VQLLEFSYHTAQLDQRGCSLSKQIDVCYKIGSVFGVAAHGSNISGKPSKCAFDFRNCLFIGIFGRFGRHAVCSLRYIQHGHHPIADFVGIGPRSAGMLKKLLRSSDLGQNWQNAAERVAVGGLRFYRAKSKSEVTAQPGSG
jgi:hypothetical protein